MSETENGQTKKNASGDLAESKEEETPQAVSSKETPQAVSSKETPQAAPSKETPQAAPSKETPQAAPSKETPQAAPSKETPQAAPSKETPQAAPSKETPQKDSASNKIKSASNKIKLKGLYLFKKGMSSVYDEKGKVIPVTVLEYKPSVVSQIKTDEKDGYQAVQVACVPRRAASAAQKGHLKPSGIENGAQVIKEIRQTLPEGVCVGQKVQIESLVKGDKVNVIGHSKGRGFAGVMKRWGFRGGPASHGSGFHRRPGSIGNCAKPGRVMPGRKMPGHFGVERVTIPHTDIVDVIPDENVILVKGPVPGSMNSLVQIMKVS